MRIWRCKITGKDFGGKSEPGEQSFKDSFVFFEPLLLDLLVNDAWRRKHILLNGGLMVTYQG